MLESKVKILDELNQFVHLVMNEEDILKAYTNDVSDFTRRRKLPFDMLVMFITKLCKKTLSIELENFFSSLGMENPCTGSAFTQQRKKLKASFFQSWNELLLLSHSYHCANEIKRWKGYRLIAVDGSNISLINTPKFREYFGGQSNQRGFFVQAKTLYCYDVLNELIINAQITPYRTGELTLAYPLVKAFEKDNLLIYDRNFFNYKMMALHLWNEPASKFIIRAKEKHPVVSAFIKSKKKSAVVEFQPSSAAIEGLSKEGFSININKTIEVRLIRVELENNVEILATNLWKEPCATFKELYSKRWGIETNISMQKNILQLECFSGLTIETIYQDFFATVFMANLHSVLIKQAQEILQNSTRKYPVKVNKNRSMGKLRSVFVQLFRNPQIYILIEQLNLYFTRDPVPIRTGRSYPRIVKNKQSKSKHKTYTNFKLAA